MGKREETIEYGKAYFLIRFPSKHILNFSQTTLDLNPSSQISTSTELDYALTPSYPVTSYETGQLIPSFGPKKATPQQACQS